MKKSIQLGGVAFLALTIVLTACTNSGNNKATKDENSVQTSGNSTVSEGLPQIPWIASKNTTRINTDDPIQAAVLISQTLWMATSEDNRPGSVILTSLDNWQNAVLSADLIHHPSNGPILFVNQDGIPEVTANEMKRLKPKGVEGNRGVQAILVGDLDEKVAKQTKELGFKMDSVTADNPAALGKAIDAYYAKIAGETPASVIIGSMDRQEYTMPAINWIAHMPEPLLYVKKDEVPQETKEALQLREGKANIYILGPESVISAQVENELNQYGATQRISGEDPYTNAVAFAKYKDPKTGFGWGITTPGHNFSFVNSDSPNLAIAAAPFSHLGKHAPLLWTSKDSMPESVMSYVMSVQPKFEKSPTEGPYNHAWLTGTVSTISEAAQGEIDSMLEIVAKTSGGGHGGH
ncbi:cell wall-binding repeat-containing protein [Paenibacillus timonensis]|uniref:Cell wall-binding repeat-containing protein n=1 Tax=Paenibacillus timonensis TaxID=225915 RepID=A0ABW3SFQ4_9BACL|nr:MULTISPECIES: cell wall-binding repeat-containing protein [Paenibacillus]MCH1642135.1 cell wall-binding repeat-containing protein [Paenibacillus timonensis]MDU2241100.1 cell wall-binding repeat-containing protein [Paenibacillus sp.]